MKPLNKLFQIKPATRCFLLLAVLVLGAGALLVGPGRGSVSETASTPSLEGPLGVGEGGPGHERAWTAVGKPGLELGAFDRPRGIVGLPDGGFFVADRSARMQRFDAQGKPVSLWEMKEHKLGNPKGLAYLPNGNLLVCNTHYGELLEMSFEGEILKQWAGPGMGEGQCALPQSCVVDVERKVVYICEYDGERVNHRIQKFDLDGNFIRSWGGFGEEEGRLRRPEGITVDREGHVFVADSVNHRIQKFDADGKLLKVFGSFGEKPGQFKYPYDIACSPDQKLYVAEFGNHRISVFDLQGLLLNTMGVPGQDEPGQFYSPWSLTVDAFGRLLVSDTGNGRIQILKVSRGLQSKLARQ